TGPPDVEAAADRAGHAAHPTHAGADGDLAGRAAAGRAAHELDAAALAQLGDVGRVAVALAAHAPAPGPAALLGLAGPTQERLPAAARVRLGGEAAEVGAVAPAEQVGRALRPVLLVVLDVARRHAVPRERQAAELPEPGPVARVHPAVRRDHAGVVVRLQEVERVS